MGALDHSDQMVSCNCFQWKTLKWWKRFFHMPSLSVVSAYILYKEWIALKGIEESLFYTTSPQEIWFASYWKDADLSLQA